MDKSHPVLPPFYSRYVKLASGSVLPDMMEKNGKMMAHFVNSWTAEQAEYRYAPEKWSAREVIIHLTDSERIFAYRALRFARKDPSILPGFDENLYARMYAEDKRSIMEIVEEMKSVRSATIQLFRSFNPEALDRIGEASGVSMTVQSIGQIIVGHELHHKKVLEEKYFPN